MLFVYELNFLNQKCNWNQLAAFRSSRALILVHSHAFQTRWLKWRTWIAMTNHSAEILTLAQRIVVLHVFQHLHHVVPLWLQSVFQNEKLKFVVQHLLKSEHIVVYLDGYCPKWSWAADNCTYSAVSGRYTKNTGCHLQKAQFNCYTNCC